MKTLYSTLFTFSLLCLGMVGNAQNFCGKVTMTNRTATIFEIRVDLSATSTFGLGSSNIVLDYNNSGLSSPTLVTSPLDEGNAFYNITVTNPNDPGTGNLVTSINIEYLLGGTCNPSFHYEIGTTDTDIATIQFTIDDQSQSSQITWIYNGATATDGTVIFLCDDATQLAADDVACLSGLDALLPIKLKKFDVFSVNNSDSHLDWSTSTEINGSHFEIERSPNGQDWITVDLVNAIGNSYAIENYNYVDRNAIKASSDEGKLYYRLKMVDLDGSYKYSEIKGVQFDFTGVSVQIYPNPTVSSLFIEMTSERPIENGSLEIVDLNGKRVGLMNIDPAKNETIRLEMADYNVSPGVYWIRIFDQGATISNQRVIVVD